MTRWLAAAILMRMFSTGCECAGTPAGEADAGLSDAGDDGGPGDAGLDAGADAGSPPAPGTLDPSFGDGGIVWFGLTTNDTAFALAVQPDRKVLAAGCTDRGMTFLRLTERGTLDPAFGADSGVVAFIFDAGTGDCAFSVRLTADGGIAGGGNTTLMTPDASYNNPAMARLRADGTFESSFGQAGSASFSVGDEAYCSSMAALGDGSFVLACQGRVGGDYLVLKVQPNGQLDPTFNGSGIARLMSGPLETGYALAVQANGSLVIGGLSDVAKVSLARFTAAGAVDLSFGDGGLVTDDLSPGQQSGLHGVAIQPDGKIVGMGTMNGGLTAIAVRYDSTGARDPSFGDAGIAVLPVTGQAYAGMLDSAGRVVIAGQSAGAFLVGRFLPSGAPDPGFGPDGGCVVFSVSGLPYEAAWAVSEAPDGKLVVGGPSGSHFGFARLWP